MQDLPFPTPVAPDWEEEDYRVLDALCDGGLVTPRDAQQARLERTDYAGLRAVG